MVALQTRYIISVAAMAVLTSCVGGQSTPPISPAFQHDRSQVRKLSTSCPCLYVVNWDGGYHQLGSVTVYPAGAHGDAAPIQNIGGIHTQLNFENGITVDGTGNIYVTNEFGVGSYGGTVTVFAAGATGDVAPLSVLNGPATGLNNPWGIALDPIDGNMYVANNANASITIYAPGAAGNTAPIGIIQGSKTGLNEPAGLALDSSGNVYVSNLNGTVTVYAAGSVGNVAPLRTIANKKKIRIDGPYQLALDSAGKVYLANEGNNSVAVYAAGANGKVKPARVIAGAKTQLAEPYGIGLDGSNNIYVGNFTGGTSHSGSITVYSAKAKKNAKPINTISGPDTGLLFNRAIAIR